MMDYISTLISGFRRDVDVICGLLGNYTASCGNNYHTTPCNYPKDHILYINAVSTAEAKQHLQLVLSSYSYL
jgi:hypothetical protein